MRNESNDLIDYDKWPDRGLGLLEVGLNKSFFATCKNACEVLDGGDFEHVMSMGHTSNFQNKA